LSECPNIGYLSSCFMVNSARESALLADRRNASRTVSNGLWKPWISTSTTGKPPLWIVRPGDIHWPSELLQQRPVVLSQPRESALIARLEPRLHRLPHLQTSAPHVVANSELVSASPVTCEPTNNSWISWSRGHLRFRRTNNNNNNTIVINIPNFVLICKLKCFILFGTSTFTISWSPTSVKFLNTQVDATRNFTWGWMRSLGACCYLFTSSWFQALVYFHSRSLFSCYVVVSAFNFQLYFVVSPIIW